ncbi:hypothetical protein A0256_23260 [Mucilaginibacter sp. PAMC 26640]|nr:hypothetical protein A0256_23260 [Mucilaginibacter sp. PAMC 26640]
MKKDSKICMQTCGCTCEQECRFDSKHQPKKNKFKKGDIVKVIKVGHNLSHIESTVNTVRRFSFPYKYFVDTPGFDSQYYTAEELEIF